MRFGALSGLPVALLVLLLVALAPTAHASVESEIAFHKGVIAYGEERWDEARAHFERVLEEDGEDTAAMHYLAMIADSEGDVASAIAWYDRAIAVDPEDPDLLLDKGALLLVEGRVPEARDAFQQVIEIEPDNARAQLLAGMSAYRAGDHEAAKPYLARAGELDPTLRDDARYYTGLSEAVLGNVTEAASAFNDTASQSPLSPIGKSAAGFAEALERGGEPPRPWRASMTAGMEFDTNPLVRGDTSPAFPQIRERETDARGVIRPSASYTFLDREGFRSTVGYDGYLSFHVEENDSNLQTHNAYLNNSYDFGNARVGLRYDYAFSTIDRAEPLRHLHRLTPSLTYQEGDWGATVLYYQYHREDWLSPLNMTRPRAVFSRDGDRHVPGVTQFFFLPAPFTYVRVGFEADLLDTKGTEFERNAYQGSFGAGYDFDYDISLAWLYRFEYRDFDEISFFEAVKRRDYEHRVTAELSKFITKNWEATLATGMTWNDSNVAFFDYNRYVGGAYLTYHF